MEKKFDLEHQYAIYLERVSLEEDKMQEVQKRQLKQTFMAACGQVLLLLRDDVSELPEEKAIDTMKTMLGQVGDFFLNIMGQKN